jgi:hypothetical protein
MWTSLHARSPLLKLLAFRLGHRLLFSGIPDVEDLASGFADGLMSCTTQTPLCQTVAAANG